MHIDWRAGVCKWLDKVWKFLAVARATEIAFLYVAYLANVMKDLYDQRLSSHLPNFQFNWFLSGLKNSIQLDVK